MAGLAVAPDADAWTCVQGALVYGTEYWVGLHQRAEGAEPLDGWYWVAFDGLAEVEVAPFDLWGPIPYDINNAGAGWSIDEADCARLTGGWSGWAAYDCICDEASYYAPLCMVAF
jgi:hypothetical protein